MNPFSLLYGDYWPVVLVISGVVTWTIGLLPPWFIRYYWVRRRLSRLQSFFITAGLWFFNVVFFKAFLGTQGYSLPLVATFCYMLLRKKPKNGAVQSKETLPQPPLTHSNDALDSLKKIRWHK